MLNCKIISGLDKPLLGSKIEDYKERTNISVLRGEKATFQMIYTLDFRKEGNFSRNLTVNPSGELAKYTTLKDVQSVPAVFNYRGDVDDDFITTAPSLIPDVLAPLSFNGRLVACYGALKSLWIEIEIPENAELSGKADLKLDLEIEKWTDEVEGSFTSSLALSVDIIDATLPEQELIFTQWFHHDCLANYYRVKKWSDEHFEIIEKFAKCAKKNGINMLFTPIITPPLDNAADTRDLQLADVTVTDSGYEFGWDKLDRWIDICDRVGIEKFEIGHLFTQGGAAYATKVSGVKNGVYQRLFAKDVPCDDPEYVRFLRALLTSLIAHMRARGDDKRMMFHISDEPSDTQLETYNKAKSAVADLLEGYHIFDALSHYDFYERGVVKKPVVILHHLEEFAEKGVPGLWTYNCCAPAGGYSNRFLPMTLSRNRSLALVLYKYNIEGFLHWGFNFYNTSGSYNEINPFHDTNSGGHFPSGDAFSVYPGTGGTPLESMRLSCFADGLCDLRAFKLCESLYSRDEVISALEAFLGAPIKANTYINSSEKMHALREMINEMIKAKI
ncbi:MAG: DUF4091 domain-containing protein [Clostridia bacterium]|nr:DUF4091 domain-containing protein [Clostridia bacterium]